MSHSNLVEATAIAMKFTNAMPLWLAVAILAIYSSPSESKSFPKATLAKPPINDVKLSSSSRGMPAYADDDVFVSLKSRTESFSESLNPSWVNYSDPKLLWNPQDIPYFIDPSLANYTHVITTSISKFSEVSCLRFRELYSHESNLWPKDYLYFNNSEGCASFIGRQGGAQLISLQAERCTADGAGKVMHLILHSLGFGHEHNRPDRDEAIRIHWLHVNETKRHYLIKYNGTDAAMYNESYDYDSLMHGSNTLFTINSSLVTLTARNDSILELGNRDHLSEKDIRRLNARYSCSSTTEPPTGQTGCDPTASAPTCYGETRPTLADPTDCTKYYVCQGLEPIRMPCPEGLFYNPLIFVCDWPWATICCPATKRPNSTTISQMANTD
ncbi:hatching enzyme 1.2-like [Daphnia pulex]|uniref:hatching enzyme 1.2-like n=1 Tax=Daphnia pulex TaxID=6669 RepID=UPI001EDF8A30|nr:hatching enzyme 1.2-like [Daphnia pulex]